MAARDWDWVEDKYDRRAKSVKRSKRNTKKARKMTLRDHRRACGGR